LQRACEGNGETEEAEKGCGGFGGLESKDGRLPESERERERWELESIRAVGNWEVTFRGNSFLTFCISWRTGPLKKLSTRKVRDGKMSPGRPPRRPSLSVTRQELVLRGY
jgi:hypothetical protein